MLKGKRNLYGIFFMLLLLWTLPLPAYAAEAQIQIRIDNVAVTTDVSPEVINNRVMVPLRVICENLGAKVNWSDTGMVTLCKNDTRLDLNLHSGTAVKNGEVVALDSKPFIKNERTMVPLRLLAESLGCTVTYKDSAVTVDAGPFVINGVEVQALQHEYHMTMGGVIQRIQGHAYQEAIYHVFLENTGELVEEPADYGWRVDIDTLGYYKIGQYDFLDQDNNRIKAYDIYGLVKSFPPEMLVGYPDYLVYDAVNKEWHLFNDTAMETIIQLILTAGENGFITVISNTVV